MALFDLQHADEALVRAEMRGGDYGVFVSMRCAPGVVEQIEPAVDHLLEAWPALSARVVRHASSFAVTRDHGLTHADVVSAAPLDAVTLLASRGGSLFRYHVEPRDCGIQFLFHHLIIDADTLAMFLEDFDGELSGHMAAPAEWPWLTSCAARADAQAQPRHTVIGESLPAKRVPRPGAHVRRVLDSAYVERLNAVAQRQGVTTFALLLAAAARLCGDVVGTVVSRRMASVPTRSRAGNATEYLALDVSGATGHGGDFVRSTFRCFVETWAGRRPQAQGDDREVMLLSFSESPSGREYEVIQDVVLGEYVVKYPQHVQFQSDDDGYLLEVYRDPGAQALASRYLGALEGLIDECEGSVATTRDVIASAPEQTAGSRSRPVTAGQSVLSRILAASDDTSLRELGIESLDVLRLLDELAEDRGRRATVELFYSWEYAGDVRAFLASGDGTLSPASPIPGGSSGVAANRVPQLTDMFMDAFRYSEDLYAVEYAFVVSPGLGVDSDALAAAARTVLDRHEIFSSEFAFVDGAVVMLPGRGLRTVRRGSGTSFEEMRFAGSLSVRAPQLLWDVAVYDLDGCVVLYVLAHHLLMDQLGLLLFVDDVLATLRDPSPAVRRPVVRWADVAADYEEARLRSVEAWTCSPPPSQYHTVGRLGFTAGQFVARAISWDVVDPGDGLEAVLTVVTCVVAEFTGERRGIMGSVHHGRTVPGTDKIVGSFARVLPLYFDVDNPEVLAQSVHRLMTGQTCTVPDLAIDVQLPFPIVFQLLRNTDAPPEGFVRQFEFGGLTKFGVLLNLLVSPDYATLEVTVASDLYDGAEAERLFSLMESAVSEEVLDRGVVA